MNIDAIATLRRHLPEVFNPSPLEHLPEDAYTVEVSITDAELNEVESAILESLNLEPDFGSVEEHFGGLPQALISQPNEIVLPDGIWGDVSPEPAGAWGSVLVHIRGPDGFPGAPRRPKLGYPLHLTRSRSTFHFTGSPSRFGASISQPRASPI